MVGIYKMLLLITISFMCDPLIKICEIYSLKNINNDRLYNCIINNFENCHYINGYNKYINLKLKCYNILYKERYK